MDTNPNYVIIFLMHSLDVLVLGNNLHFGFICSGSWVN